MVIQFWSRGRKCDLTALHCTFSLSGHNSSWKRHSSVPEGICWLRCHRNCKDLESLRSDSTVQRRQSRRGEEEHLAGACLAGLLGRAVPRSFQGTKAGSLVLVLTWVSVHKRYTNSLCCVDDVLLKSHSYTSGFTHFKVKTVSRLQFEELLALQIKYRTLPGKNVDSGEVRWRKRGWCTDWRIYFPSY